LTEDALTEELDLVARRAVNRCLAPEGFVLYSGGIDSTILACLVNEQIAQGAWSLFTLGTRDSHDLANSRHNVYENPALRSFSRIVVEVNEDKVKNAAESTANIVKTSTLSHFEDCTAFFLICEEIVKLRPNKTLLLLTANGPDELFCGYDRFRRIVDKEGYTAAEEEIDRALQRATILQSEVKLVAAPFDVTIEEPFFDPEFVNFCQKNIPIELKILKNNDTIRKRFWRSYGAHLGLSDEVARKPKKAMQYSMGIHKTILSLIKRGELSIGKAQIQEII
jgi:asparagine synthase (glutamine-hydrolysing)